MKFFVLMLALTIVFLFASFAALMNANPGLTLLTFCPLSGVVYPLMWVAGYRLSRSYSVKVARRG